MIGHNSRARLNTWPHAAPAWVTAFATAVALFCPFQTAAQGCAMCYQNAAASGAQGRVALQHGILILLIPALSVFVGICGLMYRRRNTTR
jgi:hypothetical protein